MTARTRRTRAEILAAARALDPRGVGFGPDGTHVVRDPIPHYDIERLDGEGWHGDLGDGTDCTRWPSVALAEAAIDSLRSLGPEWFGEYRIVDHETRTTVARRTLSAERS